MQIKHACGRTIRITWNLIKSSYVPTSAPVESTISTCSTVASCKSGSEDKKIQYQQYSTEKLQLLDELRGLPEAVEPYKVQSELGRTG